MKRAAMWMLGVWSFMVITEGALRYLFASAGLPLMIYAKDGLLLLVIAWYALRIAVHFRINTTVGLVVAVLVYGVLVALWHRLPAAQVVFGAKIFVTFLVGYTATATRLIDSTALRTAFRLGVPLVVLGLAVEMFFDAPWAGFQYEALGETLEGSRAWGMSGLPRLAGFGRVNFETANILFCLAALYLAERAARSDRDARIIRFFDATLLTLCFVGIVATTAKTALLAFLALTVILAGIGAQRRFRGTPRLAARAALQFAFAAFGFFACVPPILAAVSPAAVTSLLRTNNLIINILASSYVARMERMWPEALALLNLDHTVLTGRGIGGIGTAQLYFESSRYNAADNLYVYLTVAFGITIAALALAWFLWRALRHRAEHRAVGYLMVVAVIGLVCGATTNVIESAALMMTSGIALALWNKSDISTRAAVRRDFRSTEKFFPAGRDGV